MEDRTSHPDDAEDGFDALLRDAVAVPERPVHAPGRVVGQRYRLDHPLGEGGMGVVWAATHEVTKKQVAVKFMQAPDRFREDARARFVREARAAAASGHPSIVTVHDVFESDGELLMVMDLLHGETLRQRLDRAGSMPLDEAATCLLPVVSAIASAHRAGVVHRDLKPENIFLDGSPPVAKVLDFGVAKLGHSGDPGAFTVQLTRTGQIVGTAAYMAPEQACGERDIDARADVWSLGAILYECLTGRRFVEADNPAKAVELLLRDAPAPSMSLPDAPRDVRELLDGMLARDRQRRHVDLRAALDVLSRHRGGNAAPMHASARDSGVAGIVTRRATLLCAAGLLLAAALWWASRNRTTPAVPAPAAPAETPGARTTSASAIAPAAPFVSAPPEQAAAPPPRPAGASGERKRAPREADRPGHSRASLPRPPPAERPTGLVEKAPF